MKRNRELFHLDLWDGLRGLPSDVASWVGAIALGPGENDGDLTNYLSFVDEERNGDLFSPVNLVQWRMHRGTRTKSDQLAFEGDAWRKVVSSTLPYLTFEQVQGRLTLAKGSCPICGLTPEFEADESIPKRDPNRFRVTKACHHFRYQRVSGPGMARKADSWQGATWPYVDGRLVATPMGRPVSKVHDLPTRILMSGSFADLERIGLRRANIPLARDKTSRWFLPHGWTVNRAEWWDEFCDGTGTRRFGTYDDLEHSPWIEFYNVPVQVVA